MKREHRHWLENHFGDRIVFDEPMCRHTTFGIGGPANIVTIKTDKDLQQLIHWANVENVAFLMVGAGSNLLVQDSGIEGLVVKLANGFESIERCQGDFDQAQVGITAGAGVLVRHLGKYALDHGLAGLNFTLGIPGTVGGAIRMNAGAWGEAMADTVTAVTTLNREGHLERFLRDQLCFSYRSLDLESGTIVLRSDFLLEKGDREALRREAARMQRSRAARQPLSIPSAGSVFRNPEGDFSAGELIDRAGLKGTRFGEAEISTKHANFIVNRGNAKASDVLTLMERVQDTVLEQFGIQLEPEVMIVG